nr:class I SAM-dependent methyltransferase [uncultured Methylophaga sp.]
MWDERYNTDDYVYGIKPNDFLRDNVQAIPKGRVLSLAEGEGRNAAFLAKQGYSVTAVDASKVGLEKTKRLAEKNKVEIECIHADLSDFDLGESQWDGIISIFCPLPPTIRKTLYQNVMSGLKANGVFLLEAYTPEQLHYGTGGGSTAELMQTKQTLIGELPDLSFQHLLEMEREVKEGIYHTGLSSVVQAIAVKNN